MQSQQTLEGRVADLANDDLQVRQAEDPGVRVTAGDIRVFEHARQEKLGPANRSVEGSASRAAPKHPCSGGHHIDPGSSALGSGGESGQMTHEGLMNDRNLGADALHLGKMRRMSETEAQ